MSQGELSPDPEAFRRELDKRTIPSSADSPSSGSAPPSSVSVTTSNPPDSFISSSNRQLPDALSVDVEDYFHVEAFADRISPEEWPRFSSRVADNTRRILELFEQAGVKGTFFTLGCVAEQHPGLVREIIKSGHEVGCHSYLHQALWRLTPEQFRADTIRAIRTLEAAGGQKVLGYRAPTFSVVKRTLWAIEILAEEGFLYDSSVFPVRHDLYGIPKAPRFPYRWLGRNGMSLVEIPPLTVRAARRNLPAAGGGYLRILPLWYTRWALRRVRHEGQGATMYFHPWEIDPAQPRLAGKWKSMLRHYWNLRGMEGRIRQVLKEGQFVPFKTFLAAHQENGPLPTHPLDQPL